MHDCLCLISDADGPLPVEDGYHLGGSVGLQVLLVLRNERTSKLVTRLSLPDPHDAAAGWQKKQRGCDQNRKASLFDASLYFYIWRKRLRMCGSISRKPCRCGLTCDLEGMTLASAPWGRFAPQFT